MHDQLPIEIDRIEGINCQYNYDYSNFNQNVPKQFKKIHAKDITYNEFFKQFMKSNIPVIIEGIADQWECMNWLKTRKECDLIKETASSSVCDINFNYLIEKINQESKVPIANCNNVYYNSHAKLQMKFGEFLDYWQRQIEQRTLQIIAGEADLLYLKDWHLRREHPNYQFYRTPLYFASDWLNEYCDEKRLDDYRFCYMGPKGTWTPFHSDVFSSYSWSTNIVGSKKWLFFAPSEENKLKDSLSNIPFSIDTSYGFLYERNANFIEIIQNAGETVFVPSGWHHQVWNLDDTISINHNWFNGCNLHKIWTALYDSFGDVRCEIDDCKDMNNFDEHCQLMLKSVFGLNFEIFLDIINCIVRNRIRTLSGKCNFRTEFETGKMHAIFDLESSLNVLNDFHSKIIDVPMQELSSSLINDIKITLEKHG